MGANTNVYILHGYADRDHTELVCMMFDSVAEAKEFARDLPGTYRIARFKGVDYDRATYVKSMKVGA